METVRPRLRRRWRKTKARLPRRWKPRSSKVPGCSGIRAHSSTCNHLRQEVTDRLRQAYEGGQVRLARRIHALRAVVVDGKPVDEVAKMLDLGEQTVRDYRHSDKDSCCTLVAHSFIVPEPYI